MELFHHLNNSIHLERLTDERIETSIIALLLVSFIIEARDRNDSVYVPEFFLLPIYQSKIRIFVSRQQSEIRP